MELLEKEYLINYNCAKKIVINNFVKIVDINV